MKEFYKLFNSGTSDGVRKAWLKRRTGVNLSHRTLWASRDAVVASENAGKSVRGHKAASDAHARAAFEIRQDETPGDASSQTGYKLAQWHDQQSAKHGNFGKRSFWTK